MSWASGALQSILGDPRLVVLAASLLPGLEARYAVILGLALGLSLAEALAFSALGVLALALALTLAVGVLDSMLAGWASMQGLRGRLGRLYARLRRAAVGRAGPYIERWGSAGLALFIAAPLPVTGMYTGSLAALVLGVRGARLAVSLLLGGLASLLIVAMGSALAQMAIPG
ncbi:small multi-drug export protein [Stetteria hydrogenophila]